MAKNSVERLLELKAEIEKAKLEKAQLEGALQQNMQRLEEEFGVTSIEKAKIRLKELQDELELTKEEIDLAVEKLEREYEW